ncbi:DUF1513 domain-containing protein [Shimia biformata]|uniref:DUF1513 domain-containing protein n=1 Tax=Shimia biformata TaxID=1294299 RepID=UPI00194F2288|nr:DUF1513 domain-containing protein [Shimia biformata]
MTTRRQFIAGMLAAGLGPVPTWADAGSPAFLSAAKTASGDHVLVGLRPDLSEAFRIPLPTRGHAAAAHPNRPEAVGFARRPGTFALVIDCRSGQVAARMDAPTGRHFYGHGTFSRDGDLLFTTENDYEAARGVIGVWDVTRGYQRIAEFSSGGVGPHEMVLMPDGETLVIANGGIETHPDSGRAKLNIPMMRPNLSYCRLEGTVLDRVEPDSTMRRNSIRHLAVRPDGTVIFGMQWQGEAEQIVPLAGTHRLQEPLRLLEAPDQVWRDLSGYVGSVAASQSGDRVAVTSPRGNRVVEFDADGTFTTVSVHQDVCGLAGTDEGFVATTGNGLITSLTGQTMQQSELAFDNHLLRL